ncbi:Protein DA1-related 2 [Capsicum annuum]|uniref:Protein DA1-related 2 n=1 Tax=Capsicum annuum TaxID=4072 RepID=A0A1U8G1T8_CAPAN|nr:protein DA1-related 2 isoform X1 [Capsicum annuum]KAF3621769.1 Protein DA1-related 2 [Capsicum annuum]PHT86629.1 Protein DA1-related 2 [Capsicum annuum]
MSSSSVNQYSQPCIYGHVVSSYAERKSRFMKWLTKIFKGGSVNRGLPRGHQPQFLGDENMFWRAPLTTLDDLSKANKEKEELDHATAVSLTEDLKQPGYKCRTDNDEDLGRPLSHDLSSSSYPPYPPPYSLPYAPSYAPWEYNPRSYRICSGCHGDIGSGNCLGCMGTFFHPECFLCCACGYPITEHEFSLSGNKTYHKSCFREMTRPKCEVCYQFIPTNAAGLIEYRCHPFWSQKYCPSHEHDITKRCCSCERLEQWNARYVSLGDGRSLCLECMESAIMDTGDCQPLYHSIRDYYEGMNMKIEQQVPMLLVERQALNEAIGGEKHGFHHMPETRGLCLSEEQTITSLLKRPRMSGCKVVGIRTRPQTLTQKYEVTAILVLFGLPRLLTGAILAHELMHAWLRLKGFRNLSLEVEEGICQVLSYMWLESEVMLGSRDMPSTSTASSSSMSSTKKGFKSGVENKLGEFFMHQIAHDTSPTYGGGFRAANEAVNKYGLRFTLDHIRLTGSFPL